MTNTTIFAIIALTSILLLGTSMIQAADHGDAPLISNDQGETAGAGVVKIMPIGDSLTKGSNAIPAWVKFNMQSYLDEQISERELLDAFKFLEDKGIMHKSQEAAQEMADLRAENAKLRSMETHKSITSELSGDRMMQPGSQLAPSQTPVIVMPASAEDKGEALNHLRKAYDLNPNLQTKIMQYDKDHKDWIIIESWSWGESTAGDPDRPIITGNIPNPEHTSDMVLKGSKIHENAPAHDGGTVIVFTGLEFASETVHDLVNNGETSTTGWDEGVAAFTTKYGSESSTSGNKPADTLSVQELLNGFNVAIDKEILVIESEIAILEELMDMYTSSTATSTRASTQYSESDFQFIQRHTNDIDTKIQSLQTGLRVLEDMLPTSGDAIMDNLSDDLRANFDLPNSIDGNQDKLDSLKAKTTQINADGEFWFEDLVPGS